MRRVLGLRDGWAGISKRLSLFPTRPLSTNNKPSAPSSANGVGGDKANGSLSTYEEAYRQLDKLDFMTAAKMLFTTPPQKKKFGLDFHLVQLFFACMPSLAVYLVAQYARYEMRRMEAELEEKKKVEEEAKAKEIELNASKEKEDDSNPELLEVKVRLEKLEETLKEFVGESKKQLDSAASTKNQEDVSKKKNHAETIPGNTEARSEASISQVNDEDSEQNSGTGAASSSQVQGSDSAYLRGTLDDGGGT